MDNISKKVTSFFGNYKEASFKKGETIIKPGEPMNEVFFIKSGVVRLYTVSKDGNETTFNLLKPDTYFSMISIITDIPNKYYFEALTSVEVLTAPKKQFLEFIKSEPEVLYDVTKRILTGLNGLLLSIENLTSGKAKNRIATIITILTQRFGVKTKTATLIDLPLTHQQIANLVGLTRETTSLEIEKMISEKYIKFEDHKILVLEPEKIEDYIAI